MRTKWKKYIMKHDKLDVIALESRDTKKCNTPTTGKLEKKP